MSEPGTCSRTIASAILSASSLRWLESRGAVSRAAASKMLAGLVSVGGSDCAVVTTGIAGPQGGTADKPVGLVYLGAAASGRRRVAKRSFKARSRLQFKMLAAFAVMKLLLDLVRSEGEA